MNYEPNHERGLLRRQIKDDVINHMRARDSDDRLTLADVLVRGLTVRLKAFSEPGTLEAVVQKAYGGNHIQRAMLNDAMRSEPWKIVRAAVSPANTTVSGWASELVGTANYSGLLPSLMPKSAYAQLSQRGLRIPFENGAGIVMLPARLSTPLAAGDFIGEGSPIPSRRLGLMATTFGPPKKLAVLSHFSAKLQERSIPAIENVLRQSIADDTAGTLDTKMLDNVAGSAIRPPGLLNGISATTATAGGGAAALGGDLSLLATAIPSPQDLTYIMTPADYVRASALLPGLSNLNIVIAPTGLAAKVVIGLDAADFVSGEGDTPRFDMSDQATIHSDDTTPLAIGTVGSPNTIAAPTHSLYQEDLVSLRMVWHVLWAMRRSGRIAYVATTSW